MQQDPLQHQYAVVKKTGSKRDVRENLERENSAIFKVKLIFELNSRNIFCLVLSNGRLESIRAIESDYRVLDCYALRLLA